MVEERAVWSPDETFTLELVATVAHNPFAERALSTDVFKGAEQFVRDGDTMRWIRPE